jgi:hypothetical protein
MNLDAKYPDIHVQLSGKDGNAMSIVSAVSRAMRKTVPSAKIDEFVNEALSGDYDNVLQTAMRWVDVS